MPIAETYNDEFKYMPWGDLVNDIVDFVVKNTSQNDRIVDLMCGTGYLLSRIREKRPDLELLGIDLEKDYIDFAKKTYPNINFVHADVLSWSEDGLADIILCTGGIHHVAYERQEDIIAKFKSMVKLSGVVIVADPYISDYSNEEERKRAAAELGNAYLVATTNNGATPEVIDACREILKNDVQGVEYKTSVSKQRKIFNKYFSSSEEYKTWPKSDTQYGDYYFILKP